MKITPLNVGLALFALLATTAAIVSYTSDNQDQSGEQSVQEAAEVQETTESGSEAEEQAEEAAPEISETESAENVEEPEQVAPTAFGVVDVERVLVECDAGIEAMRILSAMNERFLAEVNILRQELEAEGNEDNYARLSETAALLQATIAAEQDRLSALLMGHLQPLLEEYRVENGYAVIVEAGQARTYDDAIDITNELITVMNEQEIDLSQDRTPAVVTESFGVGNATQVEGWDEYIASLEPPAEEEIPAEANATEETGSEDQDASSTGEDEGEDAGGAEEANATEEAESGDDEAAPVGDEDDAAEASETVQ
ncbi:MAG: OmpH family outer membrane protein [Desulfovibrio sp.]|nr:MAG: OmpH family outer membrane protein [Desulfovibrio sp.]